jgi:hypothetical protein
MRLIFECIGSLRVYICISIKTHEETCVMNQSNDDAEKEEGERRTKRQTRR